MLTNQCDIIESDIIEREIIECDIIERDIIERDNNECDIIESDIIECDFIECDIIEGQICGFGFAAESSVGVSDVRSSILDLLRPLGITERYFGVRQLIQAVEMVMENPDTIHALQKEVLSVIGAQYSVSWGAVERNLRSISQKAWDTDSGYVEKLAGYPMSKRPTASQLIEIILHSVQREQER